MTTLMRKPTDGLNSKPPAWVHYRCFACWAAEPGNVMRSAAGDVLGVYIPEGRFRVPGRGVYMCCICRAWCRNPTWFVQPADDQPTCSHDPDTQAVRQYNTLYRTRGLPVPKAVLDGDDEC